MKLLPFNQWPHREQVIGRASITAGTTLQIDQTFARWETVSQRHVRIYFDQAIGHSIIEDLDSDNGLYVQGRRTARNLLKDGLTITLGGVNFIYREKQPDNQIIMRNQERG
ncbi:MAG: hypothetical protein Kow0031_25630 [Anaerolineae bacterium]